MEGIAIEVIYVLPKRENRWIYVINNGKRHIGSTDEVRELVFSHLTRENRLKAIKLFSTLDGMLVLPDSDKQVYELQSDTEALRERNRVERKMSEKNPNQLLSDYKKLQRKKDKGLADNKVTKRTNSMLTKLF